MVLFAPLAIKINTLKVTLHHPVANVFVDVALNYYLTDFCTIINGQFG